MIALVPYCSLTKTKVQISSSKLDTKPNKKSCHLGTKKIKKK